MYNEANMLSKQSIGQIVRYILVGGVAFLVEYTSFLLLFQFLAESTIVPQSISFSLGLLTSFLGSRLFTFSNKESEYYYSKRIQFFGYIILATINLFVTNILIYALVEQFGVEAWVAKAITMFSVVLWNYILFNRLIFRKRYV